MWLYKSAVKGQQTIDALEDLNLSEIWSEIVQGTYYDRLYLG